MISIKKGKKYFILLLLIFIVVQGFMDDSKSSDNNSRDYPEGNRETTTSPNVINTNPNEINLMGPYQVVRVVDGDTIILEIDGVEERVRLIGIDTPESVHPDSEKNVPYGQVASDYTKLMLEGKRVQIELDVEERDQYNRILAYVYLDGLMFNMTLLQEGHAVVTTYPPNIKYVDTFTQLQKQARAAGKGLWQ